MEYLYKRGIKIAIQEDQIHCEPHVKTGNGEHLYEVCINIDEFSKIATIVPITNNSEGCPVAKDPNVKSKDKLIFNKDGALKKTMGVQNKATVNAIALSDECQISNDVYFVKVAVFENKTTSKDELYLEGKKYGII